MMERVTMIHADQWELVAEDVKAGRCEVSREEDFSTLIKEITTSYAGGYLRTAWYPDPKSEVSIIGADDVLYIRWLDTAPASERDTAAYAEFEAGHQAASESEAGDAPSVNVFAAYVGELEAKVASLQAERDELQARLAAAGEESQRLRGVVRDYFDDLVNEHLGGFGEHELESGYVTRNRKLREAFGIDVVKGVYDDMYTVILQSNPQPAPTSELVAAVKPFADAIEHAEGLSDEATVISDMLHDDYHIGMITLGDIRTLVNAAAALKGEENTK